MSLPIHATADQTDQTQNVRTEDNPSVLQLVRINKSLQMQHDHDMQVLAGANHRIDILCAEKTRLGIDLMKCREELDRRNAQPAPVQKFCKQRLITLIWCFASFMSFAGGFVSGCVFGGM